MAEPNVALIYECVEANLRSLVDAGKIHEGQIIVIGTSTSEVLGEHIGTLGSIDMAKPIFEASQHIANEFRIFVAYQCCEHLNRALVVDAKILKDYPNFEEVTVVPVAKAGGSMATYAYHHMEDPVVIELIQAHAGLDIGDTLIGMHLRKVAVPFRPPHKNIGYAHVTMAYTRPKLIGGARAQYVKTDNFISYSLI
jgi:uncharacterized protein (TIGR01440 family)